MSRPAALLRRAGCLLARGLGRIVIGLVTVYQFTLSPLLGPRCRFWPSCSHYTVEAIRLHGPFKGGWLSARRIVRCHPGSDGGIDPVPGGPSEQLCREDDELDETFCCRTAPSHREASRGR